jgi:DNA-binding GntR family transcriptional regulator
MVTILSRPPALRQNVADVVRQYLFEGRFQPGEELSDRGLATQFGVSRGPVREALMILAEDGLLEHNQHRGFVVPRLTAEDLNQIADARQPLEVRALELARPRMTPESLGTLKERMATLVAVFGKDGRKLCATPDFEFHSFIWELSGNRWLQAALRRISMPYFVYVSAFALGPSESEELLKERHQMFVDYLAGKSQLSAMECVEFHVRLSRSTPGESFTPQS